MPQIVFEPRVDQADQQACSSLRYQGGTVVVDLHMRSEGSELVLPADVLRDTGDFFKIGLSQPWTDKAKTVVHPETQEEIKIVKYELLFKKQDNVLMLDTGGSVNDIHPNDALFKKVVPACFYLSEMADGFLPRNRGQEDNGFAHEDAQTHLLNSRTEHWSAFAFLFEQRDGIGPIQLSYRNIANIVAISEMYGFFHLIAIPLREQLLAKDGLWNDVRRNYCFHLALSLKLRCEEVYCEAVRHYVGSGSRLWDLEPIGLPPETIIALVAKKKLLQADLGVLSAGIQVLTLIPLTTYTDYHEDDLESGRSSRLVSHPDPVFVFRGQDIARKILEEWFNMHMIDRSYIHQVNSMFYQNSLRKVCDLATEAVRTGTELDVFDKDAASNFVKLSSTIKDDQKLEMIHFVEEELKKLIGQIANMARPYIAARDPKSAHGCTTRHGTRRTGTSNDSVHGASASRHGRANKCETFHPNTSGYVPKRGYSTRNARRSKPHFPDEKLSQRVGQTAIDNECNYFTCIDSNENDIPWRSDDYKAISITGLEPASEKWLAFIGLAQTR